MKLKCMLFKPFLVRLGMMVAFLTVSSGWLMAKVTFSSSAAAIMLGAQNSKLRMNRAAKIIGWSDRSIVKSYGNNFANAWPEAYQADAVIGQGGQPTVTAQAYTNLVDANSNAIMRLSQAGSGDIDRLSRANSGALLYLHRVDSSAIVTFSRRGFISEDGSLPTANSNTLNFIDLNLVVPTIGDIDGTQFFRYRTGHHVFHNGAYTIRGWVRFNDGFTVMPQASVIMDTLVTVSGGMDLRDTGMLILNNDLYLSHNVTLTNGGNIKGRSSSTGQANTIFMGGDLTLAADRYARTLHITGDWSNSGNSGNLIIDGCGHTLHIGDRAQLFVDQNITLTLRNMTIKTGSKSLMVPAIRLASLGSKLALDNVMFDLGADFQFKQGQLFVHNEVAVTGTSAFVYQSPKPSYITSGATWSFEQGTTFSVAPATYTDLPFTAGTVTSNNFIVFADARSALSLDGCSLQITFTGLRFSRGMVLFDNKIVVDTTAGVDFASSTPLTEICSAPTEAGTLSVKWSPDRRFVVVANSYPTYSLQVYQFNGINNLVALGGLVTTGSAPNAVAWSSDGRFLAVVLYNNTLQVYQFNDSSTLTTVGGAVGTGNRPYAVAWSPDGRFIASVHYNSPYGLQVYRFNGSSTPTTVGGLVGTGSNATAVAWSPDGRFLAVVTVGTTTLRVYRFDGTNAPTLVGSSVAAGAFPLSVAWSPDGRFIAIGNYDSLQIYRFNGSTSPTSLGASSAVGTNASGVAWSPDGRFVAMINKLTPFALQLFRFNGSSTPSAPFATIAGGATSPASVDWSPDGNFIATADFNGPGPVHIFRCNYAYTGQPSQTQGFTNGLLFGDKAKGSDFDANVQVLGSATLTIKGVVSDESV